MLQRKRGNDEKAVTTIEGKQTAKTSGLISGRF
jgi:hypothetical protein